MLSKVLSDKGMGVIMRTIPQIYMRQFTKRHKHKLALEHAGKLGETDMETKVDTDKTK